MLTGVGPPLHWATPPPQVSTETCPPASDLAAVNTFDPEGGQGPQESNPASSSLAAPLPTQQKTPSAGPPTHIGEGLQPVPARLAAKILRREFVEMHELLPEFWQDQKEGGKAGDRAKAKKRALDLNVWLQCYAVYVGVLGPKYPHEVPELMAYMISIIRASQEFEGSAWAATTQHTDGRLRRRAKRNGPVSTLPSMPSALLARPGGRTGATAASAPPTRRRTAVSSPRMTPMSANASKPSSRLSSLSLELPPGGRPSRAYDPLKPAVIGTVASAPFRDAATRTTARLAGAVIQRWNVRRGRRTLIQLGRPAATRSLHGFTRTLRTRATKNPPELTCRTSPLRWQDWAVALVDHPDRRFAEYVVCGIRHGFRVGFDYAAHIPVYRPDVTSNRPVTILASYTITSPGSAQRGGSSDRSHPHRSMVSR